jgi:hypothetical protein
MDPQVTTTTIWRPQEGPQTWLITCPVFETLFGGARGGGKSLSYDHNVLTPLGWKQIGKLKIFDKICATDGTITDVIGIYPQGIRKLYRITFEDGTTSLADGDHIWLAWEHNKSRKIKNKRVSGEKSARKYTTNQIKARMDVSEHKFSIPITEPVAMNVQGELKGQGKFVGRDIDAYTLGLLLGDGSITSDQIKITTADSEIIDYLEELYLAQEGINLYRDNRSNACEIRFIGDTREFLVNKLKDLGLFGTNSSNKFIPRQYLWAPEAIRWELLRGLMDTDGWAEEKRGVYYTTVSEKLRDNVIHLVRSLGAVASYTTKNPTYTYNDEKKEGQIAYIIRMKFRDPVVCFNLSRKREIAHTIQHQSFGKVIDKIEYEREDHAVCIKVAHPNSLFIIDDFTVTHNTDGVLGEFIVHAQQYGEKAIALCVRRERVQLVEMIERSKQIYAPLGASFHEQDKMWRFPNGARMRFAYLESDSDAQSYQGHSYSRVYVEEMGTFPNPEPIMKLMATLGRDPTVPSRFIATANPGGPGHLWIKQRYIDPAPTGMKILETEFINEITKEKVVKQRVFIPSRVTDNKYTNTAEYIGNLYLSGNEELVKAWLLGDWNVMSGAFFTEWSTTKHVIKTFQVPSHWTRFMSMDWGSASPFSVGWWAVVPEEFDPNLEVYPHQWKLFDTEQKILPKGAIIRYREWYGSVANLPQNMRTNNTLINPNKGLKLTAEDVAAGIVRRELSEPRGMLGRPRIGYRVIDPSAFRSDGGPSIVERMGYKPNHLSFKRGDNTRLGRNGAMGGWDQVRARLKGDNGVPMMYFMDCCKDAIRTLPAVQHDPDNPEDVDTTGEDHAPDDIRYACMSRPYSRIQGLDLIRRTIRRKDNGLVIHDDLDSLAAYKPERGVERRIT